MRSADSPRFSGVVLWTRVRLCRNLAGHRFISDGGEMPPKSFLLEQRTASQPPVKSRRRVYEKIASAVRELSRKKRMTLKPLTEIPDWKIIEYIERGVISHYLMMRKDDEFRGVVFGPASSVSALVNERHHLVLQDMRRGFQLERAWGEVDRLDDIFSSKLKFAWRRQFGYLGPDSECCGTGLDVAVTVHLPGLAHLNELTQVASAFGAVGLSMDAEMSDEALIAGFGQILRIGNNMAVPDSEETVLEKIGQAVGDLVFQERQARARVLKDPVLRRSLYNRITCSLAILKNALVVSRADLYEHISWLRVGIDLGVVRGVSLFQLDKMHREMWASQFLAYFSGTYEDAVEHVNVARAAALRERLKGVRVSVR